MVADAKEHGRESCVRTGIKRDTQPGSFTHLTELFGPVLAIMRYQDISLQWISINRYGLTSGLKV